MPPWETYAKTTAPAAPAGPWQKFAAPAAAPTDPNSGWGPPGAIVPVQFKEGTGEMRWAMPQIVTDTISAIAGPGKAARGEYGMEIDPETGRPTTITNDMIGDTMGTASLGLGAFNAPAKVAAGSIMTRPQLAGGARKMMQRELSNAGIPLDQVGPRLAQMGDDAMVADLSPGLQARTAAIATMPGSGQKSVVDALSARRAGANTRINTDVDAAIGAAPVPSYVEAGIGANRKALSPQYRSLFDGPDVRAVDTTPIAEELDSMAVRMRGASATTAATIRKMLNVAGNPDYLDPSPETLFETRKAVGGMLAKAEGAIEKDPTVIGTLKYIYGQLDGTLSDAVPGIKDLDAQYQELARQSEALGLGQELLDTGRTAKRPEEVADLMEGPGGARRLEPGQQGPSPIDATGGPVAAGGLVGPSAVPLRLRQGARAEIDRIIGTNINDVTAMKRIVAGEGNWNRDRLVSVFGKEKADRLLEILEREAKYSATEQLALQGSRTQTLKAAQEDIAGKGPRANPIRSAANFRFGDAAADLADNGLGWLWAAKRASTNSSLADALTSGASNPSMLAELAVKSPGLMEKSPLLALRAMAMEPQIPGDFYQELIAPPASALARLAGGRGRL